MSSGELGRLDATTLRKYTTQLVSAANKRLNRIRASGQESPATTQLQGGRFATPRKTNLKRVPAERRAEMALQDVNRLREELTRVKTFLENPTSTVKGFERYQVNFMYRILGESRPTTDEITKESRKERRARIMRENELKKRYGSVDWSRFYQLLDRDNIKRFASAFNGGVKGTNPIQEVLFPFYEKRQNLPFEELVKKAEDYLTSVYEGRSNVESTDGYTRVM